MKFSLTNKEENRIFLYLSLAVAVVSIFSLIFMTVIAATGALRPSAELPVDTPQNTDTPSLDDVVSIPAAKVLNQSSDAGENYIKKIIFVGDSTTYHMVNRGVLPGGTETKQVWCPKNGTLMLSSSINTLKIVYPDTGAEMTIAEAAAQKKPEYMVLTIGLNGSHNFTEAVYKGSYRKLIDSIKAASPNTKIILQSVFPVAVNESAWTSVTPAELNQCIDQVNQWAKELTQEYDIRYLDTQSVLRDGDQFLKQSYQSGDGVHLTKEGYNAILHYIRTHAWN